MCTRPLALGRSVGGFESLGGSGISSVLVTRAVPTKCWARNRAKKEAVMEEQDAQVEIHEEAIEAPDCRTFIGRIIGRLIDFGEMMRVKRGGVDEPGPYTYLDTSS